MTYHETEHGSVENIGIRANSKTIDLEEVKKHRSVDSCWILKGKNVYDVSDFLRKHPGGMDIILNQGGTDITKLFQYEFIHKHSASAHSLLKEYKIGTLNHEYEAGELSVELRGWKEELVDWNHGMVFQVHKYGADYMKWVNSPVSRDLKLFDSDFIEYFSKTKWYMIPIIWIPVIFFFGLLSINELKMNKPPVNILSNVGCVYLPFIALFLLGVLTWTFVEYMLHRFLFHREPSGNSPIQITLHFFFHGQHHKVPFDENRLVFPPAATSVFLLFFWSFFKVIFPKVLLFSLLCGGLFGYISYDLIHYYMHHGQPAKGSYFDSMKKYHVLHHFTTHEAGYGISSKLWDYVFQTVIKRVM